MQRESLSRLDIRESVNTQQSLRECLENLKIDNVSELSKFRQEEIRELDLPSEAKQSLLSLHAHCMDENTTLKDLLESLEQEDSQDAKFRILRSRELRNVQQSHTIRRLSDLSLSSKEHALLSDRGHLGSASTASKTSQPSARTSGKRSRSLVDLPDWRPGEFKRPCPQFNYPHEISWTTLITETIKDVYKEYFCKRSSSNSALNSYKW